MESILTSIKKLLGIGEEYTHFDGDLVLHINTALAVLSQIGVKVVTVGGSDTVWIDILPEGPALGLVRSFVYLKVKLLFDPPLSSALIESTNRLLSELEWRIRLMIETENGEEGG